MTAPASTHAAIPKPPAIELDAVSKYYGSVHAVEAITLRVDAGQIFGLIGHNGAGKSTLMKMMLGILPIGQGHIRLNGHAVGRAGFRGLRRQIGYLPENVALYDHLSGLETMRFFARLKSVDASECAPLLERVGLGAAMHRDVRGYSKGMRQRLGFAQALLGHPRLLFLDEPTNGLDPVATHDFYTTLEQLRDDGTTVLLSSHLLAEIQTHVDQLAIIANGRLVAQGTVGDLSDRADLPSQARLALREAAITPTLNALQEAAFAVQREEPNVLRVEVPVSRRRWMLQLMHGLADDLLDYELQEPSLEDVYLHHQRCGGLA